METTVDKTDGGNNRLYTCADVCGDGVKLKFLSCLTHLQETGSLTPATFNHSADLSRLFPALFLLLHFVTSSKIQS